MWNILNVFLLISLLKVGAPFEFTDCTNTATVVITETSTGTFSTFFNDVVWVGQGAVETDPDDDDDPYYDTNWPQYKSSKPVPTDYLPSTYCGRLDGGPANLAHLFLRKINAGKSSFFVIASENPLPTGRHTLMKKEILSTSYNSDRLVTTGSNKWDVYISPCSRNWDFTRASYLKVTCCKENMKYEYGQWSNWSPSCGKQTRTRQETCNAGGPRCPCEGKQPSIQTKESCCPTSFAYSSWGPWQGELMCKSVGVVKQTRTRDETCDAIKGCPCGGKKSLTEMRRVCCAATPFVYGPWTTNNEDANMCPPPKLINQSRTEHCNATCTDDCDLCLCNESSRLPIRRTVVPPNLYEKSAWTNWSEHCFPETQTRTRIQSCTWKACCNNETITETDTQVVCCDDINNFSPWSEWSACTNGVQHRSRTWLCSNKTTPVNSSKLSESQDCHNLPTITTSTSRNEKFQAVSTTVATSSNLNPKATSSLTRSTQLSTSTPISTTLDTTSLPKSQKVSEEDEDKSTTSNNPMGTILGIVVALLVVIVIALVGYRKFRRSKQTDLQDNSRQQQQQTPKHGTTNEINEYEVPIADYEEPVPGASYTGLSNVAQAYSGQDYNDLSNPDNVYNGDDAYEPVQKQQHENIVYNQTFQMDDSIYENNVEEDDTYV
eukprot:m.88096 g.88096  ORF g.88096 m.88096 type:complete len:661 (-) comp13142_c0_seq2:166-2148(-)